MLLDRSADEWLAAQAEADAWLVKPIDPLALRRTVADLLANQPT
jgi:CheY-like chemotaxis protein